MVRKADGNGSESAVPGAGRNGGGSRFDLLSRRERILSWRRLESELAILSRCQLFFSQEFGCLFWRHIPDLLEWYFVTIDAAADKADDVEEFAVGMNFVCQFVAVMRVSQLDEMVGESGGVVVPPAC